MEKKSYMNFKQNNDNMNLIKRRKIQPTIN